MLNLPGKAWIPAGKCGTKTAIDQLSADLLIEPAK